MDFEPFLAHLSFSVVISTYVDAVDTASKVAVLDRSAVWGYLRIVCMEVAKGGIGGFLQSQGTYINDLQFILIVSTN